MNDKDRTGAGQLEATMSDLSRLEGEAWDRGYACGQSRIEQLEAALKQIARFPVTNKNRAGMQMIKIARAALAPEQDK